MKSKLAPLIFLSAGGTGGHVTPAQALSDELRARGCRVALVTDRRGHKYVPIFGGVDVHVISAGTFGPGLKKKIKGMFTLALGFVQSLVLISKHRPDLVIGFGGYPSVPAVFMAQRMQIRTIIHEQNAVIGKANAFLAAKAERIAMSLANLQGLDESELKRAVVTGNPVRKDILALASQPYPVMEENGILRIFVMGGSLGARVFSDVIPKACGGLFADYRSRLHIMQQCRAEDIDEARAAYAALDIRAELAPFIRDVAGELAKAHLFIGRSGASTVAEVTIAGRPSIFVPYPYHKDQQQKMNANAVADTGGAWVMTENGFTVEALQARLQTFLQNPGILQAAAAKSRLCGRPDATSRLADLVQDLLKV
ncbi:MAG: undecaprenyldiphospho-muramoylpentapeptide beta-N-acetylglucosaminyltransferase [Alphaproteobacteria bacterium]